MFFSSWATVSSGCPGEHLDDHPPRGGDAEGLGEHPQEHRRAALLALLQIVGHVVADLAAHQGDLAVVAGAPLVLAEHPESPLAHRPAHRQFALRGVRDVDMGIAHHAAQVPFLVGLGEDPPQGAVAADLQQQAARRLGRQPQEERRAGQAATEGGGGNRRKVEPIADLLDDVGDVGDRPAERAVTGEPELQEPRRMLLCLDR